VGLALASACSSTDGPEYKSNEFGVYVDSVRVPGAYVEGDSLFARFYAYLGPDGCHRFDRFEVDDRFDDILVSVWGRQETGEVKCATARSFLRGKRLTMAPRPSGDYRLIVRQPNGKRLIYPLEVAPPGAVERP
jgi:hypothetical protein